MKILLISGHGAGDSGAVGCGHKEADLTRTATSILSGKFAAYDVSVTRYPVARDAYQDNRNGSLAVHLDGFDLVIEVHFNSYNGEAYGTEVLYKPSGMKALASKVSAAIASCGFYNRGAKRRTDLANMNLCARLGVPYILIETCFIDNSDDMTRYGKQIYSVWDKVASAVCAYYGIRKLASGGQPVTTDKTPKPIQKPATEAKKDLLAVDGYWGQATTKAAQKYFGTYVDGIVSNQPMVNRKYLPNCSSYSWEFKSTGYRAGSSLVRAIQRKTGATADGFFGVASVRAFQKWLGVTVDGSCGMQTVKAFQRWLNARLK